MPNIGDPAPQFSATDVINNQIYKLSDYAGQVVLLIFSGPSWCGFCKFEAPVLQELWEIFDKSFTQPRVQFLMVSCFSSNETPQEFKDAVQNFELSFPALLNPNDTISSLYEIEGVPTLCVVDTQQKICNIHEGAKPPADALYEKIYSMLIGCGAAEPKPPLTAKWADALFYEMLYGLVVSPWVTSKFDPAKLVPVIPPGPKPKPLSSDKKDILLQLAITEFAKGIRDFKTSSEIEAASLKGAQESMRKLVAKNALQPKELDKKGFSKRPNRQKR
jgi:peroxiredoxin